MENKVLFKVKSKLEQKDYRKFLYLTTFRKSPFSTPLIGIISLIATGAVTYANRPFTITKFLIFLVVMTIIAFGVVCLKVEYMNSLAKKNDGNGLFKEHHDLVFSENNIMVSNKGSKEKPKIQYSRLFRVLKTEKYLVIYYNTLVSSLIRKEDLDEETWTGLNELLQNKVGKRFKKC